MMKMYKGTFWGIILLCSYLWGCTKSSDSDSDTVGNWIRSSDFEGVARSEAVMAVLNDKVYVGLGYDGKDRLTDLWEYDASLDFWRKRADFPGTARSSAVAFAAAGRIYVGLGFDGVNELKDFFVYDPAINTWEQVADFPGSERYDAVGFSLNGKGYVCGGYDGNYLKDFYEYNPSSNEWTQKVSPGGSKRTAAVAFVIADKAYLVTGSNNGSVSEVNDLYVYDGAQDKWTEKRRISDYNDDEDYDDDYNIVRENAVAFAINGRGYISTGSVGGLTSTTWEYDPDNDLWEEKTAFEATAREGAIAFGVNGRAFVALGRSSSLRLDDVREFKPGDEYDEND